MASGDYICEETAIGVLTPAQRTSLANILGQLWPGALTDLTHVMFQRNPDNTVSYVLLGDRAYAPTALPNGARIKSKIP